MSINSGEKSAGLDDDFIVSAELLGVKLMALATEMLNTPCPAKDEFEAAIEKNKHKVKSKRIFMPKPIGDVYLGNDDIEFLNNTNIIMLALVGFGMTSLACIELREHRDLKKRAWNRLLSAQFIFGFIHGRWMEICKQPKSISDIGKLGAAARHVENHALRQEAFNWLDENFHKFASMDAAASTLFSQIVPVTFRTARDWTGQHRKLRSAGTP